MRTGPLRRSTAVPGSVAFIAVVLVACGSVTQDLGNDVDAALAVTDTGTPPPAMDASVPDTTAPEDTSRPDTSKLADGGCAPSTCATLGWMCGSTTDGCGHPLVCGTCSASASCNDAGACIPIPACTPRTCAEASVQCGPTSDGCGNLLQCGTCSGPQECGANGLPGQCGMVVDGGACVPMSCAAQNIACGPAGDGCGNVIDCGACTPPQTCGGGDAGPSRCG